MVWISSPHQEYQRIASQFHGQAWVYQPWILHQLKKRYCKEVGREGKIEKEREDRERKERGREEERRKKEKERRPRKAKWRKKYYYALRFLLRKQPSCFILCMGGSIMTILPLMLPLLIISTTTTTYILCACCWSVSSKKLKARLCGQSL